MIGVMFFMQMMGYSGDLLTLLAMVLAIGLVVDDAIVVVENIHGTSRKARRRSTQPWKAPGKLPCRWCR